jgi:protein TonB
MHPPNERRKNSLTKGPLVERRKNRLTTGHLVVASVLAACGVTTALAQTAETVTPSAAVPPMGKVSSAASARDYRRDAASHLYSLNAHRIWAGKMPPLLHAVAVLQVELDGQGGVSNLTWMRAPSHAPEVVAEIERTVRKAAPFPAPVLMGHVTYTDTWLWHKSGKFQLDTLTEGQL